LQEDYGRKVISMNFQNFPKAAFRFCL